MSGLYNSPGSLARPGARSPRVAVLPVGRINDPERSEAIAPAQDDKLSPIGRDGQTRAILGRESMDVPLNAPVALGGVENTIKRPDGDRLAQHGRSLDPQYLVGIVPGEPFIEGHPAHQRRALRGLATGARRWGD